MKAVKVRRRLLKSVLLLIALFLSSHIFFFAPRAKAQAEAGTIKIINPLSTDNKFDFNLTTHPVNSTFTADFYVENVTAMVAWQIYISWNNTIINFQKADVPDSNAFAPVMNERKQLIVPDAFVEVDSITNTATLMYGAAVLPASPVDVPEQALLCEINFTIATSPVDSQIFTNIQLLDRETPQSASLMTFVMFQDPQSGISFSEPVYTEPAIVRISKTNVVVVHDVAITSLTISPPEIEVGDSTNIVMVIENKGNDIENDINVTIRTGQTLAATFNQTVGAYQSITYQYSWNSSGFRLDIPDSVSIFGIPVVASYHAQPMISVDLTIAHDINLTDNHAEAKLTIDSKLRGLDYVSFTVLLWVSSSLGQLLITYTAITVVLLATFSMYGRLRTHKPPSPSKTQKA
jgi:hypothetical protein